MSAEDVQQSAKPKAAARGAGQMLVDLGPVVVFVLSYNLLQRSLQEDAIFWATGLFMVATFAAIAYSWVRTRHIPPILMITGVLVLIFGGLTIALKDRTFVMIKPIFVYLLYAGALLGALMFGRNLWKMLLKHALTLPDRVWDTLALRWGLFFLFMAVVSALLWAGVQVWGVISEEFWVGSRLWIVYPLIIGFTLLNLPLMMKHLGDEKEGDAAPAPKNAQHPDQ